MFLVRQDVIDRFDANFRETENGEILFWPSRAKVGLPISWEEYQATMDSFRRVHRNNMIMMWLIFAGAGAWGLYQVLESGAYLKFFGALGVACLLSFCIQLRDGLEVFRSLTERRTALERELKEKAKSAEKN